METMVSMLRLASGQRWAALCKVWRRGNRSRVGMSVLGWEVAISAHRCWWQGQGAWAKVRGRHAWRRWGLGHDVLSCFLDVLFWLGLSGPVRPASECPKIHGSHLSVERTPLFILF